MQSAQSIPVEIAGVGSYLPDRVLSNHDLEQMVETSDEWIVQRSGIRERRIASDDEATSDMAAAAAREALEMAETDPKEVDAVIVATCTPDHIFPASGCLVQAALGAENAMGYDLEAACSGFVFALAQAAGQIACDMADNILVIGAETLSRITDYTDRRTCILFGDGAGAVLLRRPRNGGKIIYSELGSDGHAPEILMVPSGGSRLPTSHETVDSRDQFMKLQGREVFKRAVSKMTELLERVPEQTGIALSDVKLILPHQSNIRIINSCLERSGLPLDKAYVNIDRVGNTSAASIPLALDEAVRQGLVERGDLLLLLAFGGGLTWASMLLQY